MKTRFFFDLSIKSTKKANNPAIMTTIEPAKSTPSNPQKYTMQATAEKTNPGMNSFCRPTISRVSII